MVWTSMNNAISGSSGSLCRATLARTTRTPAGPGCPHRPAYPCSATDVPTLVGQLGSAGPAGELDQAVTQRRRDRPAAGRLVQLAQHRGDVVVDGPRRHVEPAGDGRVG